MQWNRRDFIVASSLGLAGALGHRSLFAQARGGAQPPAMPEFKDVRRNVGTFFARGGTIGYLVTPDAVVVVDSQFADTAPLFLEGMKPKTQRKFDLLINSHHHGDHTGGNKVIQPNVAKIVAHANVPGLQKKAAAAAKSEANQA
jgi:glyoxylase-like metal-dependent hydrolase (beta-lactamase superfamily II)